MRRHVEAIAGSQQDPALGGSLPARRFGLHCEYVAPDDDAFMALEIVPGALARVSGLVRYAPAFANF